MKRYVLVMESELNLGPMFELHDAWETAAAAGDRFVAEMNAYPAYSEYRIYEQTKGGGEHT